MAVEKCMICGGELFEAVIGHSPFMDFAIVKDEAGNEKYVDIKTYMCKRCGNLTARRYKEEDDEAHR